MVAHQAQRGKCLRSRLGEESDGRREPKALDSTSHPETAGHSVASPGRSAGARPRKLTHSVRRQEPLAPRHESGCEQANVAVVASRLTIPTGFHIANATGVEATTEPMREIGHQDVACQRPTPTPHPARTASETSPSALPSIPMAGALENARFLELFNAEGVQALMNQMTWPIP